MNRTTTRVTNAASVEASNVDASVETTKVSNDVVVAPCNSTTQRVRPSQVEQQ